MHAHIWISYGRYLRIVLLYGVYSACVYEIGAMVYGIAAVGALCYLCICHDRLSTSSICVSMPQRVVRRRSSGKDKGGPSKGGFVNHRLFS